MSWSSGSLGTRQPLGVSHKTCASAAAKVLKISEECGGCGGYGIVVFKSPFPPFCLAIPISFDSPESCDCTGINLGATAAHVYLIDVYLTGVYPTGVHLIYESSLRACLGGENPYIDTKDVLKLLNCGRLGRQAAGHPWSAFRVVKSC